MPLFDEDGQSGSGISPKTRLDLPSLAGDMDAPLSRREFADVLRKIKDWSSRLEFGRAGFNCITPRSVTLPQQTAFTPWTWTTLVEDSHSFSQTFRTIPLQYFQVPPGQGRVYNISYNFDVASVVLATSSFVNDVGAVKTYTVPAGVFNDEMIIYCRSRGGEANSGGQRGGGGSEASGTFTVTTGQQFNYFVSNVTPFPGWPNGGGPGFVGATQGGNGGGASRVAPIGLEWSDADMLVIAGGGGGRGAPLSPNGLGGAARHPQGDPGAGIVGCIAAVNATGSSQIAAGVSGGGGVPGNQRGFDPTGAPTPTGGTANNGGAAPAGIPGGGGGGGYLGGGGSGGITLIGTDDGGGGAGGASYVKSTGRSPSFTTLGNLVTGLVSFSYFTETPTLSTDFGARIKVAYAQYPGKNPYEQVSIVAATLGVPPQNASVQIPLGEGDRVWVEYFSNPANIKVNATFSMYAQGM